MEIVGFGLVGVFLRLLVGVGWLCVLLCLGLVSSNYFFVVMENLFVRLICKRLRGLGRDLGGFLYFGVVVLWVGMGCRVFGVRFCVFGCVLLWDLLCRWDVFCLLLGVLGVWDRVFIWVWGWGYDGGVVDKEGGFLGWVCGFGKVGLCVCLGVIKI